ncbi:LysR substrate-binding domain-containing protein [Rahnella woolbedingensis]|uniref:LysR family transcriptional regulator n=1 Tax=Rahnella woolbedingensis TaxID=1510574 RepID=A0A419N2J2_9GAMM|nr:LysR substrate-binding domain-containing protein [Rahnella woolbedingensis]RJT34205.1 LysR family transcriptional regulator [Rahnella woolbedingensis]
MKITPLPPLNSLVAFEAASRHLSFTLAAHELNVTQGAISRQIRHLEDFLGSALFSRINRNIQLTMTGLQYRKAINMALVDIASATGEVKKWQGENKVTVSTTSAMAALWLLPRIASFQNEHEEIDLRIMASDSIQDLRQQECDFNLFYCRTPPENMQASALFSEVVFPVCSPDYLQKVGPLSSPEEIFSKTLLFLEDSHTDWLSWEQWFTAVHLPQFTPKNRLNINNYPMLLQAAINGQGVALAWGELSENYLESGALIRPVNQTLRTTSYFSMLEATDTGRVTASVRLFREWLLNQRPATVSVALLFFLLHQYWFHVVQ